MIPWRDKPWLSIAEAAEVLSLSESTVRGLVRDNTLTTHKIGRRVMIPTSSLCEYIDESMVGRGSSEPWTSPGFVGI